MRKSCVSVLIIALIFAFSLNVEAGLVVDTDMGLDDARSIFALVASEREVATFVTVGGSTAPGKGADNLIGLLEAAGCREANVIVGMDIKNAEPPPWRKTASKLAGEEFPPPRYIEASHGGIPELRHIVADHIGRAEYLALGPLTNLSSWMEEEGENLEGLIRIWIPVSSISPQGMVEGWNLSWDSRSAEKVLKCSTEIILVDVSGLNGKHQEKLFSELNSVSPAGKWIKAVARSAEGHVGLYDEVAAAAAVKPSLFSIGGQSFSVEFHGDDLHLKEEGGGNIKVARVDNPGRVVELLAKLWTDGGCNVGGEHHHSTEIDPLRLMKTFHGHLGPWLVIGYRAGKAALGLLKSSGHFGVSARVSAPARPPVSCFIDGVQLGSGCTLGKRNIVAEVSDGPPVVVFDREGSRSVRISIPTSTMDMVKKLVDEYGVEKAGRIVWEKKRISLFRAEFVDSVDQ